MKKMRILYYSDCEYFGGSENMLAVLFNSGELHKTADISFIFNFSKIYLDGFLRRVPATIDFFPIKLPQLLAISNPPKLLPFSLSKVYSRTIFYLAKWPLMLFEVLRLCSAFRKLSPEILHINNGGYPAALSARCAAIAGKLAGVPSVVMVVNNLAIDYSSLDRWTDLPCDRLVVRSVDKFITGSQAAATQLQSVLGLPPVKIMNIYNGVSLRATVQTEREVKSLLGLTEFEGILFGVVSVLEERKGHRILLDALLSLKQAKDVNLSRIKILIEGTGVLYQELVNYVGDHSLQDYVMFVGHQENISDIISILDVLILPSISQEDFPNVVVEAMSLAKPVIASNLAGVSEQVIENETGILVEPRNIDQLAQAIRKLANNSTLRKEYGQAGLKRFESNFRAELAINKYHILYQSLSLQAQKRQGHH
jgi:glycosyltransferase involved in cell wall biosynthesis